MGTISDEICQKVIDQCDEFARGLTLILPSGLFYDRGDLSSRNNNLNILGLQESLSSILSQSDIVLCSGGLIKYEAGFCLNLMLALIRLKTSSMILSCLKKEA